MQVLIYLLLSLPLVGAYAMLAIGIVVVFRASRVLNLAHGAMAMLPAYVCAELVDAGLPVLVALVAGVGVGALLGAAVERLFVRPLARQGPTAQTVGTVAVYGLVVAAAAQIWGSGSRVAPTVFPEGGVAVAGSELRWGQLGLFVVALLSAGAFLALFRYTSIGLALRGAAENPRAAGLMGIDPNRMARMAWMLGGGLAALAGILLAAVTNLQPYSLSLQMLPAFVAALIGGFGSLPAAVLGAAVVGAAQGMVPAFGSVPVVGSVASQVGMPQLVLTVIAVIVMYRRGGRVTGAETGGGLTAVIEQAARVNRFAITVERGGGGRRAARYALLVFLVAWPMVGLPGFLRPLDTFSVLGDAILAGQYFIAAASIVLLTGWAGQISLCQASFIGISAFGSARLAAGLGISFPWSLITGALLAAGASAVLGVVALRVRGLYLAVATLIFAWMADEYLFVVPWFAGTGGSATTRTEAVGAKGGFPYFDFNDRRTFYYVTLAVAAAVLFGLLNLRDSKAGRAVAAVRGSEMAASSLGIDVVRTKLVAFATAGFVAGLSGSLTLAHQVTIVPEQFSLRVSLLFLAIAVVGGLRSLGGAAAASVLFAALSEVFFRVPSLGQYLQLVSAVLLAGILLVYPKGLAGLGASFLRALQRLDGPWADRWRAARARFVAGIPRFHWGPPRGPEPSDLAAVEVAEAERGDAAPEPVPARAIGSVAEHPVVLEADDVTVRFGGLTAVDSVSLAVRQHQIVGLIGPNGAGKTTLFNAISGLNDPTSGRIRLFGEDVTPLPVHERAGKGLARTFQVIQLFADLTVFENLLVATHLHNETRLLSNVLVSRRSVNAELAAEEACRRVVRFLGLDEVADRPVAGLPFGTLRMVEIARAVVTEAPVIMLDEPASGLDNRETDKLVDLLLHLRSELGVSILLIEHDVRMVAAVTDYTYVVNRGKLLAHGRPSAVQRDPSVIAAYLGSSGDAVEAHVAVGVGG